MSYKVVEYLKEDGSSPYGKWFLSLNKEAAAKVVAAKYRIEQGNLSNLKRLSGGIAEYKIDFGPGYRIYLGEDGKNLIILLAGGTKKRQQQDIKKAQELWAEYKESKKK